MFANYLKEKKTIKDIINVNKAEMYEKLFKDDSSKTNFLRKKILPYGWHWLYFSENYSINQIGVDGHPKRGIFFLNFRDVKECLQVLKLNLLKILNLMIKTKVSKIKRIEKKVKKTQLFTFCISIICIKLKIKLY